MVLHTSPRNNFDPSKHRPHKSLMDRFVQIGELLQASPTVNFHEIPIIFGSGKVHRRRGPNSSALILNPGEPSNFFVTNRLSDIGPYLYKYIHIKTTPMMSNTLPNDVHDDESIVSAPTSLSAYPLQVCPQVLNHYEDKLKIAESIRLKALELSHGDPDLEQG